MGSHEFQHRDFLGKIPVDDSFGFFPTISNAQLGLDFPDCFLPWRSFSKLPTRPTANSFGEENSNGESGNLSVPPPLLPAQEIRPYLLRDH